jgi:hypothetical protein
MGAGRFVEFGACKAHRQQQSQESHAVPDGRQVQKIGLIEQAGQYQQGA